MGLSHSIRKILLTKKLADAVANGNTVQERRIAAALERLAVEKERASRRKHGLS